MRYCDALTSATGYGYWIFPPMDFRLLWDGEQVFWSYGEDETWLPLSGTDSGAVQFPHYAAAFDAMVPEALRGYSPPFLTRAAGTRRRPDVDRPACEDPAGLEHFGAVPGESFRRFPDW